MKTKFFTSILVGCISIFICPAQAPNWQWANRAGGNSIDEAYSVAIDATGNTYVAGGYWSPTIVFGSDTLTNASTQANVFLAKYDAGGNVLWARNAGGVAHDFANSIAVDGVGNICMAGSFVSPSIIFGSDTLHCTGLRNAFLTQYDAAGNVLWATSPTGANQAEARSVAVDGTGNFYIAGYFQGTSITFGSTTLTNANAPDDDLFLVKYDANGNVLWATGAGGSGAEVAWSVAVDGAGNSFITGHFDSPSLTFGTSTLTNPDYIFLAKYDVNGNALWGRGGGGSGYDYARSVAVDGTGNAFITGYFKTASIIFGNDTLTNASISSTDLFLAKYDGSGNVLWAKRGGATGYDYGYTVAVDGTGNSYVGGAYYSSTITFGPTVLTNGGAADLFVAKYDAAGNALWAKGAACTAPDNSFSIGVNGTGDCAIAGFFGQTGTPTLTLGSIVLTNAGSSDMFLAKFNSPTGIEEELNSGVIVYPNPSASEIIITSANYLNDATLILCNAAGQEVKSIIHISGHEIKIQRNNLPDGIYFIQLMQDHETLAKGKLVIID